LKLKKYGGDSEDVNQLLSWAEEVELVARVKLFPNLK
jgi:hypothetical protein